MHLHGLKIAVTGRLASMTHDEFRRFVEIEGGIYVSSPSRSTKLLVVGQDGLPLDSDGEPSEKLKQARRIRAYGYNLEILTEDVFLDRVGATEVGWSQQYTIAQLSRILHVDRDRIRAWVRAGLIEPTETSHRLAYFNFRQVAMAKQLCELVASGHSTSRIRSGLERLSVWLPGLSESLSKIAVLEHNGRLAARLESGMILESSGQYCFDFEAENETVSTPANARTADEWFVQAVANEDEGDCRAAALAYAEAIRLDPSDPVLHFNAGNVLHSLERNDESIEHFRQAVRIDPEYTEAWNNLGSMLNVKGHHQEAISAFQHAVAIDTDYADAHFNLAASLADAGRNEEAIYHWKAYLQLDVSSEWADEARERIAELSDSPRGSESVPRVRIV